MGFPKKNVTVIWDTTEGDPRACILVGEYISGISELMYWDLVAVRIRCCRRGIDQEVVLESGYFASDRPCPPPEVLD